MQRPRAATMTRVRRPVSEYGRRQTILSRSLARDIVSRAMKPGLFLFAMGVAFAQSPPPEPHEAHEGPGAFEAEFVASDIFRSATYLQPLWRRLKFEGEYFGGTETDVGFTGASWTFAVRDLKLSPACGVLFGSNRFATTPAVSFRWEYEHAWFVTQGLIVQGFRETPVFREEESEPASFVRPTISDGNHLSARWHRLTVGGTWEYVHFREGDEWKGGGRLAVRLFPRVSAILYVLGPGQAEWRGGILIHPSKD